MDLSVSWPQLKEFVKSKYITIQYVDLNTYYAIVAISDPFVLNTIINKDGNLDQIDFETNYKV